jgi:uncharacterized protein (TIGR02246 family)
MFSFIVRGLCGEPQAGLPADIAEAIECLNDRSKEGGMRTYPFVVALCLVFIGCATSAPVGDQDSTRAIEEASDRFITARQSGDASSFAAQFADDGMFMVPGLEDASGRAAVEELARKRFAGGPSREFVIHRREIRALGDSAHELAWFAETTASGDHRMEGRHSIVWKRGSDRVWRVHRYLYAFSDAKPLS